MKISNLSIRITRMIILFESIKRKYHIKLISHSFNIEGFYVTTRIKFDIPKAQEIKLFVYDITGRKVSVLVNGFLNSGSYEVTFNGENFSSGVYFYTLQSKEFNSSGRFVLVK